MIATKRFALRTILSVTTERLLTEPEGPRDNGIGRLYELLNWMTSDDLFTHQLGRASVECAPWLLKWFPEIAECGSEAQLARLDSLLAVEPVNPEEVIANWFAGFPSLPETYDVPKIPAKDHKVRDPLEELSTMIDPAKIMVFPVPEEGK